MKHGRLRLLVVLAAVAPALGVAREPAAELYAEGTLSTPDDEAAFTLSPDGQTAVLELKTPATLGGLSSSVLCVSRREEGTWTRPRIAPFSGQWRDRAPSFAPDGRLLFASDRPAEGKPGTDFDLWTVRLASGGWGEPRRLPAPINTPAHEIGASVARSGSVYFASTRPGGKGEFDLWRARPEGDGWAEPENLGAAVNSEGTELSPAISPDERTLVFVALGRDDERVGIHRQYAHGDLYVSQFEGAWSPARNAGPAVNSAAAESSPFFTADGAWLYFISERGFATLRPGRALTMAQLRAGLRSTLNGMGNVYRVRVTALDALPAATLPKGREPG